MFHVTLGWGGVAWGGAVTFTHLRTSMIWRHGTFTSTCAHTSCYVEDVSRHAGGGVAWGGGSNIHSLAHSMMWRHGTFTCTCAQMSCYVEDVSRWRWGGVGWGSSVHSLAHFYDATTRQCNHSKGVFLVWRSVQGRGSVRVHTGGIDAYWTLLKDGMPNSIYSTVGGKPNKVLWMYMRSQQWRWECHEKDILAETGQTLATLWTKKKACQYPTRFKAQNPVRVNGE